MVGYKVKEIYYTLQGEGAQTGRPAVFCRFTGCNLWSGREEDRASAICKFCDTNFWGTDGVQGGKYEDAKALAAKINSLWEGADDKKYVVFTGGEPLLQLDDNLVSAMHETGFEVAVETNGTIALPEKLDWACVSPKAGTEVVVWKADEIKIVFPQDGIDPIHFEKGEFTHFFLQPMDNEAKDQNTAACVAFCLKFPKWKLSLQTHKLIGLP
ncbi:MAG: 7-carboxy-7-deazaguanine synthase [Saprospiraceae bacterium]|nr:7-carboxy-7-deazaguanine synthase [Saprospiraceae bacterium]